MKLCHVFGTFVEEYIKYQPSSYNTINFELDPIIYKGEEPNLHQLVAYDL
jgi:hypothetical protein